MPPCLGGWAQRARTFELYRPDINETVRDFKIAPFETHDEIMENIKEAFPGPPLTTPKVCDINGEPVLDPAVCGALFLTTFKKLSDGERLLVGTFPTQRLRPEPVQKVNLYLVDKNAPKHPADMTVQEIGFRVRWLRRQDARARKNILRLTLPHADVTEALRELAAATTEQMNTKYSVSSSQRIIDEHWKVGTKWEGSQTLLATMAILSRATCAQPAVVEDACKDAYQARTGLMPTYQARTVLMPSVPEFNEVDVRAVIQKFYKAAGAIGSDWPWMKKNAKIDTELNTEHNAEINTGLNTESMKPDLKRMRHGARKGKKNEEEYRELTSSDEEWSEWEEEAIRAVKRAKKEEEAIRAAKRAKKEAKEAGEAGEVSQLPVRFEKVKRRPGF